MFNEELFMALGGGNDPKLECWELSWPDSSLHNVDPRTKQFEQDIQRIIDLQSLIDKLPDSFMDHKEVTESHVLMVNAHERVEPSQALSSISESTTLSNKRGGGPPGSRISHRRDVNKRDTLNMGRNSKNWIRTRNNRRTLHPMQEHQGSCPLQHERPFKNTYMHYYKSKIALLGSTRTHLVYVAIEVVARVCCNVYRSVGNGRTSDVGHFCPKGHDVKLTSYSDAG